MTGGKKRGSLRRLIAAGSVLALLGAALPAGAQPAETQLIVQASPQRVDAVKRSIEALGGRVVRDLPIIDGFSAVVPDDVGVEGITGVVSVTPDAAVSLSSTSHNSNDVVPIGVLTGRVLDADRFWRRGITGSGIGVALIDSGVSPVGGLDAPGKILNGPDLSFDGGLPNLAILDMYGHGTHLAGIIAGSDPGRPSRPSASWIRSNFAGVAPDAHIVNVKVADATGTADVSQVIAGIQWVVEHKDDPEAPIDILTLAFGTDGTQDYRIDPLAHAAESAWHAGIVVVVAAGNDDQTSALRNPAFDPFVISVGATDPHGTPGVGDDEILGFSNCGTSLRAVDLVAPGRSISSLRVPNSFIDAHFPNAADGTRFFRGTGTSQSAAVVAGAAALLLDQRPNLTPDQVKDLLVGEASDLPGKKCHDARALNLAATLKAPTPAASQVWDQSDGSGSLEEARGSYHVYKDGEALTGEIDVTGGTWSGGTWSGGTWSGGTWSGGTWSGGTWSGGTW
ncbi:MAG: S8 family serine peptidase, partial [Acidimicrobiia bacterium]|nr:S8 family serine peptidase [Acidimicrobiia bacterium]